MIGAGTVAYEVDQRDLGLPVARFCWRSLEQPIILPALPDSRRKAAGCNQRRTSGMTAASGSFFIENNARMDRMADLALGSLRLKGHIMCRATGNKKNYCDRNKDR